MIAAVELSPTAGLAAIDAVENPSGFVAQNVFQRIRARTGSTQESVHFVAARATFGAVMAFLVLAYLGRTRARAATA